jgi:hypothetical protein
MAMPWMYAGRRWVATRELRALRYPEKSAVAQPVTAGCYLSVYWITAGRHADHMRWTVAINKRLNRDARVHGDRMHVLTAFRDRVITVYRDGAAGPRDIHALDRPYGGLVLEVVDAETPERREELAGRQTPAGAVPERQRAPSAKTAFRSRGPVRYGGWCCRRDHSAIAPRRTRTVPSPAPGVPIPAPGLMSAEVERPSADVGHERGPRLGGEAECRAVRVLGVADGHGGRGGGGDLHTGSVAA